MRHFSMIAFLFLGFALAGCYDMHGYVPVTPMADAGPMLGGDAGPMLPADGGPIMVQPDAYVAPDAWVEPAQDAGTDSAVVIVDGGTSVSHVVVEPCNMRQSTILVADGGAVWQNVASYCFHTDDGSSPAAITAVHAILDGDAADLTEVAIAGLDGMVHGTSVFPAGIGTDTIIHLDAPITDDAVGGGFFEVWVKVANVVSDAAVSGADIGVCNSGDRFRVGINPSAPVYGNEFVIRRSRPTVTLQTLSTELTEGTDTDLIRFQVSSDSASTIMFRQQTLQLSYRASSDRLCLTDTYLRRGRDDMAPGSYQIIFLENGNDLSDGHQSMSMGSAADTLIAVRMQELIAGSGDVFTVHSTLTGCANDGGPAPIPSGARLSTSFMTDSDPATGYLGIVGYTLALDTSPYGMPGSDAMATAGNFLWSDLSEVPHSAEVGTSGGSRDWTNGYLVNDLTGVTTLTAP
ncbi:MAG TPA: hypothetical protein VMU11_01620 [Verrucomicrobiae bacterium]|nr:hypothetical protein [Verrucomicrobiae bacterium]